MRRHVVFIRAIRREVCFPSSLLYASSLSSLSLHSQTNPDPLQWHSHSLSAKNKRMARSLSQTLSLSRHLPPISSAPSSPLLFLRAQSNHSSSSSRNTDLADLSDSADPLLQKLEDAIYRIIVRRSAPDWLPFLPGASYWVPPPRSRSRSFGIAKLVEKLANPLTDEESMSTRSVRGWPSSAYFVKGAPSHPVEDESISNNLSSSEDDEG